MVLGIRPLVNSELTVSLSAKEFGDNIESLSEVSLAVGRGSISTWETLLELGSVRGMITPGYWPAIDISEITIRRIPVQSRDRSKLR